MQLEEKGELVGDRGGNKEIGKVARREENRDKESVIQLRTGYKINGGR